MNKINCELCESSFGLKSNLTKHVKKYHSNSDEVCSVITKAVKITTKKVEIEPVVVVDNNLNLLNEIERLKAENILNLEMQKLRLDNEHLTHVNSLILAHNEELKNIVNLLIAQKNTTPFVAEIPIVKNEIIVEDVFEEFFEEVVEEEFVEEALDEEVVEEEFVEEEAVEEEAVEEEVVEVKPIVKKIKQSVTSKVDKIQNILNERFYLSENMDEFITHLNEVSIVSAVDVNDKSKGNVLNTMIPKGLIDSEKDAIIYLKDKMKRVLANARAPLAVYNKKLYVKVSNEWVLHTKEISKITTKFLFLISNAVNNLEAKMTASIKNKFEMYRTYSINNIQAICTDALMFLTGVVMDDDLLKKIEKSLIKDLMQ